MKAALYLRVSTTSQEPDNQLPALESYCREHGFEIVGTYTEQASAWSAGHQRELGRLLDDVRSGKRRYEVLLVFALDRLSRQGPAAILNLIAELKNYGVKVISLKEDFTGLPYGFSDVLYSFLAWSAKYESDRKSQNTRAGLERARAAGSILGRPKGKKDTKKRHKKRPVVFKYSGPGGLASTAGGTGGSN